MRADFFRLTCALWVLGTPAFAQHILQWERFNVYVDLDNDGRVQVQETLEVFLNGKIRSLDRKFAESAVQEVVNPKVSELGEDDKFHPLPEAEYRKSERAIYWRIGMDGAPEWKDQRKTFRLEYELRGIVTPAWDIPIGAGSFLDRGNFPNLRERFRETFDAWRQPLRRYRFDHDVLFARFSNEGPRELNYTLHYDTAWKHPQPDAPLGSRVTPEVSYRVTELRDYLRPGRPPAVPIWKAAVRLGSIAAAVIIPLALWLAFAANRIRRHGRVGPRLDREWFRENVLPLIPEEMPTSHTVAATGSRFTRFLARIQRRGIVEVRETPASDEDSDSVLHLRLLTDLTALPRFERTLLGRLFPDGPQSTSTRLAEIYAESGFSPEAALGAALSEVEEAAEPESTPERKPIFWRLVSALLKLIAIPTAALILLDAFISDYNDGLSSPITLGVGFAVLAGLTFVVRPLGGLGKALVALVPIVAAIPAYLALHFHHTLPLTPAASAGLALMVIWLCGTWLSLLVDWDFMAPGDRVLQFGRRFVSRELRKRHPALEDAWLPHIVALVGEADVCRWQVRFGDADERITTMAMHQDAAPFTGNFSIEQESTWTDLLYVFSRAELAELEADEPRND